jgi:hypothetical protein
VIETCQLLLKIVSDLVQVVPLEIDS